MKALIFFILLQVAVHAFNVAIEADKAIMIDSTTGKILFEKNSRQVDFPASLVKLVTSLVVLQEKVALNAKVICRKDALASISSDLKQSSNYKNPAHWLEHNSTHIGLKLGEELTVEQLLHAILIASANDAANVLAQYVGGSVPTFVKKMNEYVRALGCYDTKICNPHGLHHPDMVTTAYDMALIAKAALQQDLIKEICCKTNYVLSATNMQPVRYLKQTNHLLNPKHAYYHPYAIGLKTGTTHAAGKALLVAAENQDRGVIVAILGCREQQNRYRDALTLLNTVFAEKKVRVCVADHQRRFETKFQKQKINAQLQQPLYYEYFPSLSEPLKLQVLWKLHTLPIEKDEYIGDVVLKNEQATVLKSCALQACHRIESAWIDRAIEWIKQEKIIVGCLFVALLFLMIYRSRSKRKSKNIRY